MTFLQTTIIIHGSVFVNAGRYYAGNKSHLALKINVRSYTWSGRVKVRIIMYQDFVVNV